ncbi:DUF4085 family protein [Cytobacillus sp.]|uniref:DUF4085 family protein n=1 Tax=Cytobacillus sp. TaxID=2675269 RepID=UPI0028BD18A8|nr:DUF4085 family protein [Cytobacillus sp.]
MFRRIFSATLQHRVKSLLDLQEEVASITEATETGNRENPNEYVPYNREKAIKQFHETFLYKQACLKKELPEAIVNEIADMRVLALNKATRSVIDAVTKFCEDNERSVAATSEDYRKYFKEASLSFDNEMVENFGFHDCTIIKSVQNGKSLTLHIDYTGGFTNIDEVTFENCTIIKQDDCLEGSWWLYEEIYQVNDKYEFHILLQNSKMGLTDFIISADQVSFKSNKKHL